MTGGSLGGAFRPVLAGGLLTVFLLSACPSVASADWLGDERRVPAGNAVERWPQLSGSRVVYTVDTGNARSDVHVYDLVTQSDQLLTPSHRAAGPAAISGRRVVWVEGKGTRARIHHFDLAAKTGGTLATPGASAPSISGTKVCYTAGDRVRLHDLSTGSDRAISPPGVVASSCDISGKVVVWRDNRSGSVQVYGHDLATETDVQVSPPHAAPSSPRVDGQLVVWEDSRMDAPGIYASVLGTGVPRLIKEAEGKSSAPRVSDGRVVWADDRTGHDNTEVYLYDLASGVETRVTRDDARSDTPTISGERIVYADNRDGGPHLYQRSITQPKLTAELSTLEETEQPALTGYLTSAGAVPVVGATVALFSSTDGDDWAEVGTALTAGDGSYSFAVAEVTEPTSLRVRFSGTFDFAPTHSRELVMIPRSR